MKLDFNRVALGSGIAVAIIGGFLTASPIMIGAGFGLSSFAVERMISKPR